MDWQQMVSLVIVGAAAGLLMRSRLRQHKVGFAHGVPCGCSAGPGSATKSSIVFHARKGERPEVRVKMR